MLETKVFQILIENNMYQPIILILVLGWLLSTVVKLLSHLQLTQLQVNADRWYQDYIDVVENFQYDIELKLLEIMQHKAVNPGDKSQISGIKSISGYKCNINLM